ncbi:uncharacterized protein LOC128198681 [Bicyclus anynana]|uniref:Uncharacterized protein LOC128198681 n=1 Tax=Bicyclus anynana TaxID=110368 RepID=A0ABM3LPS0_BICAN|nr:uncharacterized protein LOC128198681 [Bicyclus anynana]
MSDSSADSTNTKRPDGHVTKRAKKKVGVSSDDVGKRIKVPMFSSEDPELWFALLEGQLDSAGITDDQIRFAHVTNNLDITFAKIVKDIIINPPSLNRYEKVKTELIKRLSASHEVRVRQLLMHEELGDRKPSQFARHLQDLAGSNIPEEFLKTIWCSRLPKHVQTVLATQPSQSLDQLLDLADRVHEITAAKDVAATTTSQTNSPSVHAEIAELRKMVERLSAKLEERSDRSRTSTRRGTNHRASSRSGSRSASSYRRYPVCWYHAKFGQDAKKCQKPCDYQRSGNATGNH